MEDTLDGDGPGYIDLETAALETTFTPDERERIAAAHRAGGLTGGEVAERRRTALPLITEIEEYIDARYPKRVEGVDDYMDWLFDDMEDYARFFEYDKLVTVSRHLPEIAAYYGEGFDPQNVARNIRTDGYWSTKPAEYLLRSAPVWEGAVNGAQRTRVVEDLLERAEHPDRIFSQYLPTTIDLVPETLPLLEDRVYPRVLEPGPARTRTLASTPLPTLAEHLPREDVRELEEDIDAAWDDAVDIDGIRPRLRGTVHAASDCSHLEPRHWETLLADEPSKGTTLLRMEDRLVGSLKGEGAQTMLALRDVKSGERYALQKGYVYATTQPVWARRETVEEHDSWSVLDVDELPVNPVRRAGERGEYTVEQFRERIDERREQLEASGI